MAAAYVLEQEQRSDRKRACPPGGQGPRGKKPRVYRPQSFFWDDHVNDLTEIEFNRAYRMDLESFNCLLAIVEDHVEPIDETKAKNSRPNAGRVPIVVELAITLRYLAGGQAIDLMNIYRPISRSRVYVAIHRVIKAILKAPELKMPEFWNDEEMLHDFEQGFAKKSRDARRGRSTVWRGQVAAVDGVHLKAQAPGKAVDNNANYHVPRKGNAPTMLVLAACRQDRRFVWFHAGATSTSHDGQVFAHSGLGRALMDIGGEHATQKLWRKHGFFISGDSAFFQNEFMLGPSAASGTYNADYDYVQSSNRMPIECAFGILTRVWGLLWRPISTKFEDRASLVHAILRLHNFRIANKLGDFNPVKLIEIAPGKWQCEEAEKLPGHQNSTFNYNIYDAGGNLLDKLPALRAHETKRWNKYERRDEMVEKLKEAGFRAPISNCHNTSKRRAHKCF